MFFKRRCFCPSRAASADCVRATPCFIIHSSSGRSFLLLSTSAVSLILSARHMLRVMQRARICRALQSDSIPRSVSHLPWACRFMNSRIRRVMSRRLSIRAGILNFLTASLSRSMSPAERPRRSWCAPMKRSFSILTSSAELSISTRDRLLTGSALLLDSSSLRVQNSKNWRSKAKKYSSRNPASRAQTAAFRALKTSASI